MENKGPGFLNRGSGDHSYIRKSYIPKLHFLILEMSGQTDVSQNNKSYCCGNFNMVI